MKKYLLSLLVGFVGLISFGYCVCLDNVNLAGGVQYSSDKLNGIICPGGSDFQVRIYCKNGTNTPASWVSDYVSADTIRGSCGTAGLDYFTFTRYYGGGRNCLVSYNSDKLCSETFSPIFSGLNFTINEFIPYIVFISLGLFLSIIGFIAIRWFVNWLGKKIKSVFSSKRN